MDTAQAPQEETTVNESEPQASANRLVLPSLEIQNFRAFRHLTIEKLGRVNLITGKNNVGKTSLLEAIQLLVAKGYPPVIRRLLIDRDEIFRVKDANGEQESNTNIVNQFDSLFHKHARTVSIKDVNSEAEVQLEIDWYDATSIKNEHYELWKNVSSSKFNAVPCLIITNSTPVDNSNILLEDAFKTPLQEVSKSSNHYENLKSEVVYQKISSRGLANDQQSTLWDRVALTSYEDDVEDALRLLSPNLKRIAFIQIRGYSTRVPMVRMIGEENAVPLRSLGEGVNRMLGYVLSAANAAGGILLIDEIENGLHYSVLPDVWRLIFQTACRLNVQVFATTHSWDCIEAFQQAASEDDDPASGVLVRLRNKDGDIVSSVFDEEDLRVITRDGIEVR